MQFRRSGQRDERRRRVLIEEQSDSSGRLEGAAPHRAAADKPESPAPRYTQAARRENQPHITDLLPRSRWTLAMLLCLGLSAIAALEAIYGKQFVFGTAHGDMPHIAAWDLARSGNVASWLGSMWLFLASVGSVLVFAIRRHRTDDYRGRYSVWLWVATVLLLASMDAASGVHATLRGVVVELIGTPLYGQGDLWWMVAYALAVVPCADRLFFEFKTCRLATLFVALAAGCYCAVAAMRFGWLFADGGLFLVMMRSAALLLGHLALMFTVLTYARHVYLDAQGLLPASRKRPRRAKRPSAEASDEGPRGGGPVAKPRDNRSRRREVSNASGKRQRSDLSCSAGQSASEQPAEAPDARENGSSTHSENDQQSAATRKLSKAERRRQRKLKRRAQQNEAA